jgi:dipeptidyl aminopeptidase/acylaminoacyl peptidase
MRFLKLIIIFVAFMLTASISLALESNMTGSSLAKNDTVPSENQDISRFYVDRNNFETNLIYRAPAPQRYENELPPIGIREIIYDSGNLKLKAWLSDNPDDGKKHPAIVYAHGGFSFGGSEELAAVKDFLDQGFVLMAPMLRAENGNPGNFEYFYGEVNDLVAAADYLANVSYVDKDRIFLCGHSIGGTLSMLTSMMPSKYRAIASFSGSPDQEEFFKSEMGRIPFDSRNDKEIKLRSPIVYPDSVIKPLFVYLGDQEDYFLESSRNFVKKAKESGRICEINVVKGDHFTAITEEVRLSMNEFKNY